MTDSLPGTWAYAVRERLRALRIHTGASLTRAAGLGGHPGLLRVESHASANVYLDTIVAVCGRLGRGVESVLLPWRGGLPADGNTADPSGAVRLALRQLVEDRGLRPLAAAAGVHHSTLARWGSGEYRRIDLVRLERIARAAGVDPAQLALGRIG